MTTLIVRAYGRPAPQGSKTAAGREASPYLPAWRAEVKRAALQAMLDAGRPQLPLFPAGVPVVISTCLFYVPWDPIGTPDIDKLLRSTLDALGGSKAAGARVFADDAQVVRIEALGKVSCSAANVPPGAYIVIRENV